MNPEEKKVLAAFGKDFEEMLLDQSKSIIRAITEIANKSGYDMSYLQYIFYVLFKRSQDWPQLPKDSFGALNVLTKILTTAGEIPQYRDGLRIPDLDNEMLVDTILKKLSVWAQTKLAGQIMQGYLTLLKKHRRDWLKASEITPENKALGALKYFFEDSLLRIPLYTHSTLMNNVVKFIL